MMLRRWAILFVMATTFGASASAAEPAPFSARQMATARALIDRAKSDATAYEIAASLTTEVGPRLGGSEGEARARDWAVRELKRLGFKNVRVEPYEMPSWRRGEERAAIVAPFPQPLVVTALGNSPATPEGGVVGEVARFGTLAELKAAPMTGFKDKIIFVDEPMTRTQDGSGYGVAVAKRSEATVEAARRGAAAALIRSVGTDNTRFPHAGNMRLTDNPMAPAAALSAVDADLLANAIARSKNPVTVSLLLRPSRIENAPSGNVVGEIVGRTDEIIVVGGHLDSWDLGSGALDDAAGVAITMAAARLVGDLKGKPRRTLRVVLWGAEEVGLHGARAYAAAHKAELDRHFVAAESDFGSGRIWKLDTRFDPAAAPVSRALFETLRPIGVGPGDNEAGGGADVGPLREAGVPVFELNQDGSAYFDYHHTADDTLDKIDRDDLAQNVGAWAAAVYLLSEATGALRAPTP